MDARSMVARGANRANAEAIAERIRRVIADCDFEVADGVRITKTCSVGFLASTSA